MIIEETESARYIRDLSQAIEPFSEDIRDILLSILNDEQNHATLNLLLYNIEKE